MNLSMANIHSINFDRIRMRNDLFKTIKCFQLISQLITQSRLKTLFDRYIASQCFDVLIVFFSSFPLRYSFICLSYFKYTYEIPNHCDRPFHSLLNLPHMINEENNQNDYYSLPLLPLTRVLIYCTESDNVRCLQNHVFLYYIFFSYFIRFCYFFYFFILEIVI